MERFERWSRLVGWAIVGLTALCIAIGLLYTATAMLDANLTAVDRQRVLASGVAEALYNALVFVPGLLAVAASAWARRQRRASAKPSP
jgi:hypothetical protein